MLSSIMGHEAMPSILKRALKFQLRDHHPFTPILNEYSLENPWLLPIRLKMALNNFTARLVPETGT